MKKYGQTSLFTGALAGIFMNAGMAGAQDLSDLRPFSSAQPFNDKAVTVYDSTKYWQPDYQKDTYFSAFLTCTSGPAVATSIDVSGLSSVDSQVDWIAEKRNGAGATPYILGQDGIAYDMNVQENFERFARGDLKAGLKKSAPEFKEALRTISEKCGLQF